MLQIVQSFPQIWFVRIPRLRVRLFDVVIVMFISAGLLSRCKSATPLLRLIRGVR